MEEKRIEQEEDLRKHLRKTLLTESIEAVFALLGGLLLAYLLWYYGL
jgi:hypothetical protein